jgi:hypothetical protein
LFAAPKAALYWSIVFCIEAMSGPAAWYTTGATKSLPVFCCARATFISLSLAPQLIKINPIPKTTTN